MEEENGPLIELTMGMDIAMRIIGMHQDPMGDYIKGLTLIIQEVVIRIRVHQLLQLTTELLQE
jgi:hypothetical protein